MHCLQDWTQVKCCIKTFESSFEPPVLGIFVEKAELISVANSDLPDFMQNSYD